MKHITSILVVVLSLFTSLIFAESLSSDVKNMFSDIPGVQVKELGKTILVFGEVESFAKMQEVQNVVNALSEKGEVIAQSIRLSQNGKNALVKKMEEEIGGKNIYVRNISDAFYLEGVAENDYEADRAVEILRSILNFSGKKSTRNISTSYGGSNFEIIDMLRVAPRKNTAETGKKAVHLKKIN